MNRTNSSGGTARKLLTVGVVLLVVLTVPLGATLIWAEVAETQYRLNKAKDVKTDTVTVVVTHNQPITLPAARNNTLKRVKNNLIVRPDRQGSAPQLQPGEERDYVVDRSNGTITFLPDGNTTPRQHVWVKYHYMPQEGGNPPATELPIEKNRTQWIGGLSVLFLILVGIVVFGGRNSGGRMR